MKFINLTPHDVTVCDPDGRTVQVYSRSGFIARVEEHKSAPDIGGISTITYAGAEGIPEPGLHLWHPVQNPTFDVTTCQVCGEKPHETADGCKVKPVFIVSLLVAQTSDRDDLVIVRDTVRNEHGQIIGCLGFARLVKPATTAVSMAELQNFAAAYHEGFNDATHGLPFNTHYVNATAQ